MVEYGWIKVGCTHTELTLVAMEEISPLALQTIDDKLKELETNHHVKITALKEFRASLLALPAPKD